MKNPFKKKLVRKRARIQITGGPHGQSARVLLDGEEVTVYEPTIDTPQETTSGQTA